MNKPLSFRHRHPGHEEEESASPDPKELVRLLGQLVDALGPTPRQRAEREIRIRNLRSDRLELTSDLIVVIEDREGQYIASSYDTDQYGHGYSPDDAIQHLCSVIEDYYALLCEDEAVLGKNPKAHLAYLRSILRERR